MPGPAGAALSGRHLPVPAAQRPGARGPAPRVPRQGRALATGGRRAGGLQTASAARREGLRRDCCVQCLFLNKSIYILELLEWAGVSSRCLLSGLGYGVKAVTGDNQPLLPLSGLPDAHPDLVNVCPDPSKG